MKHLSLGLLAFILSAATWGAPATAATSATGYWLELETVVTHTEGDLDGMTTYRLYLNMVHPTDFLSSCSGDINNPFILNSSSGSWYNDAASTTWNAQGVNPAFFGFFPNLAYDSFLTLGAEDGTVPTAQQPTSVSGEFDFTGEFVGGPGSNFTLDGPIGGAWYLTFPGVEAADTHVSFAGDDLRVMVAQITTAGVLSGQVQVQVFIESDQANEFREVLPFCNPDECGGCTDPLASNYDAEALYDDGTCLFVDVEGCTDDTACNFDPQANLDDGSCEFVSCAWCDDPEACNYDGEGPAGAADPSLCESIADGACDCDGNVLDAAGVCGGTCQSDEDGDGVCDDVDECIGALDACGVCNGPGEIYACGCTEIPEGDCDCDGNQLDALGVCGGNCLVDADNDGWCDECTNTPVAGYALETEIVQEHTDGGLQGLTTYRVFMRCANALDYVNACSGDNLNPLVLESASGVWFNHALNTEFNAAGINPELYGNFPNLVFDSYLTIGSDIEAGEQAQAIWGDIDASEEFNGDGSGYNVTVNDETGGAWFLPFPGLEAAPDHPGFAGEEGRVLVIQMTTAGPISGQIQVQIFQNGDQSQEIREVFAFNSEFVVTDCDNLDPCVGELDACGVCNGPGAVLECGCTDVPEGDCDCEGNQLDALGICGGDCLEDNDGDGVCDILEVAGCTDETACNYDPEATEDDGSCAVLDACGECGGSGVLGCTDATACNYDMTATCDDGMCTFADVYVDCDGNCLNDADGDGICDELEVEGCTDETACNYNELATDEGDCIYAEEFYDCDGNCLNDADGDGICDELEVDGCTDETACNYDALATDDDGSCAFPGDACDDGDDTTINDAYMADCDCVGEVDGLEEATGLAWTLYPSPVRDVLNFRLEGGAWSGAIDGDVEVMVLGATGQVLRSERLAGRTQLDVSDLASGVYFVTLRNPAMAATTRRFVVAGGE